MGISINGEKASIDAMLINLNSNAQVKSMVSGGAMPPEELLEKVMPEFGTVCGGFFFTVWNGYYEDYNPSFEFTNLVARYYDLTDNWGDYEWSFDSEYFAHGANAFEVAGALGIELGDEDDE